MWLDALGWTATGIFSTSPTFLNNRLRCAKYRPEQHCSGWFMDLPSIPPRSSLQILLSPWQRRTLRSARR